ncbi:hypothetical protein RFI_26289 [Reticulomyxa filosa]|uniref:Uncharacterized protein n=1 Tax=Reticulomyxa filosa TaxID=46433 RepID=X6MB49_RETFI|nr:hypothetical protein RFI_26289 [Reticulomyxa filosa]|eukprot:ETO11089.1 hypothetical protein RFI_26289 [Reticulomyxa filosa]
MQEPSVQQQYYPDVYTSQYDDTTTMMLSPNNSQGYVQVCGALRIDKLMGSNIIYLKTKKLKYIQKSSFDPRTVKSHPLNPMPMYSTYGFNPTPATQGPILVFTSHVPAVGMLGSAGNPNLHSLPINVMNRPDHSQPPLRNLVREGSVSNWTMNDLERNIKDIETHRRTLHDQQIHYSDSAAESEPSMDFTEANDISHSMPSKKLKHNSNLEFSVIVEEDQTSDTDVKNLNVKQNTSDHDENIKDSNVKQNTSDHNGKSASPTRNNPSTDQITFLYYFELIHCFFFNVANAHYTQKKRLLLCSPLKLCLPPNKKKIIYFKFYPKKKRSCNGNVKTKILILEKEKGCGGYIIIFFQYLPSS